MAAPISWLPRLRDIRRSIKGSVQSHFTREQIEERFSVSSRSATRLLSLLPRNKVGNQTVVAKEALIDFLERVRQTEDIPALMEERRREGAKLSKRNVQSLSFPMPQEIDLDNPPLGVEWDRGDFHVRYSNPRTARRRRSLDGPRAAAASGGGVASI